MERLSIKACPLCGNVPTLGYVCGEYFIFPGSATPLGCFCDSFNVFTASDCSLIERWNDYVSTFSSHG